MSNSQIHGCETESHTFLHIYMSKEHVIRNWIESTLTPEWGDSHLEEHIYNLNFEEQLSEFSLPISIPDLVQAFVQEINEKYPDIGLIRFSTH